MRRIGLFIGIPLVLLFIGTAFAQFNRSMMLGSGVGVGARPTITVSPLAPAGTAYYLNGLNVIGIVKNNLITSGNTQYLCYYNTASPPVPKFLLRNLTTKTTTFVDPGLPAPSLTPSDDEHGDCAIAIDNSGKMHISYGQHGTAPGGLIYYKSAGAVTSTTVGGAFTKLSMVSGNTTVESSVTYPFFMNNPSTGELYFTFRYFGSGNGNQYFYHYNNGTGTWQAAAGTGTCQGTGCLINDMANSTPTSPYLNGLPKWDAAGKLWFNWQEFDGTSSFNEYLVAWNGSTFQDMTGAAVSMPIVTQSYAPSVTIPGSSQLVNQNDFTINNGVFYIPYSRVDGAGIYHIYVVESSSGAFVEHVLTSNTANLPMGCGSDGGSPPIPVNGQCTPSPVAVGDKNGSVYIVYADIFSAPPGQGVIAAKSSNHFTTFTNQVLFPDYTPNFSLSPDPSRMSTTVSFMRMDAEDYQFGYWSKSTPSYGSLAVSVPCGSGIGAAIGANPSGTAFQLSANCTYAGQTFNTKDNIQLLGAGNGSTIIDGGHASIAMTNAAPPYGGNGTAGVIIDGVTIQNYGPDTANNTSSQFYTWNGWIVRNSIITGAGGAGINLVGSATLTNSLITGNREIGITGDLSLAGALSPTTINGNEITNNNTRLDNPDNSASGIKMVGGGASVVVTNNYIHDNLGTGLWFDIGVAGATIQGNTVIHNSYHGIMWEISNGPAVISANVVNDNGWDSRMPTQGNQIYISSAANANVHDNNIRVPVAIGGWNPNGIRLNADARGDAVLENGDTFHNNTVTFLGTSGYEGFANNNSVTVTGTSSNTNFFYVANAGDLHWFWNTGITPLSWTSYQSSTGQDASSTLTVGNASVAGCARIGCTGSGWP